MYADKAGFFNLAVHRTCTLVDNNLDLPMRIPRRRHINSECSPSDLPPDLSPMTGNTARSRWGKRSESLPAFSVGDMKARAAAKPTHGLLGTGTVEEGCEDPSTEEDVRFTLGVEDGDSSADSRDKSIIVGGEVAEAESASITQT